MNIKRKFSYKDESDMLKKLSLYVTANISLVDALGMIADQYASHGKQQTIFDWQNAVSEGKTLAIATTMTRGYGVSEIFLNATDVGERTGAFAESCMNAHERVEKIAGLRKRVMSAVAYPAAIMVGTFGLVAGLMIFVFPKIIPLFETLKANLPWSTKLLIYTSRFLTSYWWLMFLCGVVVFVTAFLSIKKFSQVQTLLQNTLLRVPLLKGVIQAQCIFNIFDSMYVFVRGGDQVSEALKNSRKICRFILYRTFLEVAEIDIVAGKSFAELIKRHGILFPPYVFGLVSVGERTGNLELSFKHISEIAKEELEDGLRIVTAALEPILMVSMSLIIGFIALSIILPIYGITAHFQNV